LIPIREKKLLKCGAMVTAKTKEEHVSLFKADKDCYTKMIITPLFRAEIASRQSVPGFTLIETITKDSD
jgi:hypothetical protein